MLGMHRPETDSAGLLKLISLNYSKDIVMVLRDATRSATLTAPDNELSPLEWVSHHVEFNLQADGLTSWVLRADRSRAEDVSVSVLRYHRISTASVRKI